MHALQIQNIKRNVVKKACINELNQPQNDITQNDITQDDITQDDITQDDIAQDDITKHIAQDNGTTIFKPENN
jgi:hypothetical protein